MAKLRLDKKAARSTTGPLRGKVAKVAKKAAPREPIPTGATLVQRMVLCGKCPKLHGPYWYAAWKKDGRTRWRYIGSDGAMARVLEERHRTKIDGTATGLERLGKRAGERLGVRCVECGQLAGGRCVDCGAAVCSPTSPTACHKHAHGKVPRRIAKRSRRS